MAELTATIHVDDEVIAIVEEKINVAKKPAAQQLAAILRALVFHDTDYDLRTGLVLQAMYLAHQLGYETGYRIDPKEPEWPVAFIELPTGQVSWHMPQHSREWDGHSTAEKMRRIDEHVETYTL